MDEEGKTITNRTMPDKQLFLEQLIEMSPSLLYLYDAVEQRNIYINERSLELLGYSPQSILAMGTNFMAQVMHPEDIARMPEHLERLNTSIAGSIVEIEYRMQHENGAWRWFKSRDRVFSRTPQGRVHQILGTAEDITEQKQAEKALRESEQRFQAFMNYSPASAWIVDREGRILYVNSTYFQMFQLPQQDVVGKTISDIYPAEFTQQFLETNLLAIETNQAIEKVETAPRADGSIGEFLVYKFPIATENNETLVGGVAVNITKYREIEASLKEKEQHFTIALQTAKLGSWQYDLTTNELICSTQCKANFGLPADAEFSYQSLLAALHPEDREQVQAAMQKAIEQQTDYEIEERCFWPDGSLHWSIARGRLVYNVDGTPIRMVGVTLDITDRKQLEESLKASNQRIFNILESITDGFVAFDREWRYTYANQEAAKLLAKSPTELLGKRWQDVFSAIYQSDSLVTQELQRAVSEQVTVKLESFFSITHRWLEISAFPFPDGLAVYFRDISEAKRDEADRKQAEQRKAAQYAITRVLAEANTFTEAVPGILKSLCESLTWQIGIIWSVDRHQNVLHYVNSWYSLTTNAEKFINQQTTFSAGEGIPGWIWANGKPIWISELINQPNFPRAELAVKAGLHSGFGFPILLGNEILGVIECFSDRSHEPDEDLLEMMAAIGSQIGQFIERKRTEAALKESQELFQSFMYHTPIAAFIKDESGRHIYANPLLQRILGCQQTDIIGKTNFDIYPAEAARKFSENDGIVLNGGEEHQFLEMVQLEGREYYFMSFKFPFRDAAGRLLLAGMSIDVSDRVKVEAALRESDERFRLATRAVTGMVYDWQVPTGMVYRSEGLYQLIGIHPEEVPERRDWWLERLHPEDRPRIAEMMDFLLATNGDRYESEYRILHEDGRWIDVWDRGYIIRDRNGQLTRVVGFTSDITDRKQAEADKQRLLERIRTKRELLEAVLQQMPAGVMVADGASGKIVLSNERIKEIWPTPELLPVEKIDRPEGYQGFHPDGRPYEFQEWPLARSLNTGEVVIEEEIGFIREDGTQRIMLVNSAPIRDTEGNIKAGVVTFFDITDRKQAELALRQSEERFQLMSQATNDVVWDYDAIANQMWWSDRVKLVFGYEVEELGSDMEGWSRALHPEDKERVEAHYEVCLNSNEPFWTDEYRFRRADGSYAYLLDRAYIIRDTTGNPVRIVGAMTDISDRKQVEETLKEREKRFSTLFNGMEDWVLVYHLNPDGSLGELIEVNEQATKKLGYSREELLSMSVADIIGSSSVNPNAKVQKLLAEKHIIVESVHRTKDDRLIPCEVSATLFTLNGLLTVQSICRDITDRKQAEEALRNSERLYRAIGETIDYGIWVCQPDGRNIYASESFLRLVGLTQEECSNFGWGEVLHPDDAERTIAAWKECAKTGDFWDIEHRFRGVDGNWHPLLARGVPVKNENGEIICWAGINLDISRQKRTEVQLRESEARFRALVENAPDAIFIADIEGKYIDVNTSACRLLGYQPEELIGKQITEIMAPENLPHPIAAKEFLRSENPQVEEWTLLRKDGSSVAVEVSTKILPDRRWQAFVRDITDRKRAEKEKEQLLEREKAARSQAESANRIKDEFLAVLSHELRSPLNPILGWTKLLRTRKLDEQTIDRALETIERNAKLQTQLIEDLLDVSRILRGKMMLNVTPVRLAATIEAAIETVRLAAQAKDIQIQASIDPDVSPVSGDFNRLQQVIWNLLSNAIKFTPSGGTVEIQLAQVGNDVEICVKDSGKGITPEFLPYVFEYFRQEDGTTTRQFGGLGLGLAIVRHLIELHGGTVRAESPGEAKGATFTVTLPRMGTPVPVMEEENSPAITAKLDGVRVLAVDDEADMRDLMVFILQQFGAEVKVVASAFEVLAILEEFQPDILISDVGMPQLDGYTMMRQIRSRSSQQGGLVPSIALTAYAGEYNQRQALEAGFGLHLSKPIEPEVLVNAIAQLVFPPKEGLAQRGFSGC